MSQVVSANIKTFFTNNDKFSSKFVKILHFRSFFTRPVGGVAASRQDRLHSHLKIIA